MKKSKIIFTSVSMFLIVSTIGFASAQSNIGSTIGEGVASLIMGIASALEPVLKYTLGSEGLTPDIFLVKVLIFVLMLSIFYVAVQKVPFFKEATWLQWVVAIASATLGTRFLSPVALINLVWLPTGVLGVTLTTLLPFIIFFFFIESFKGEKLIRRTGWILFGILYLGLAATRWDDFIHEPSGFNLAWLYVITAILAGLSFLFDKKIQKKKEEGERKKGRRSKLQYHELDLAKRLRMIDEELSAPGTTPERMKELKEMEKNAREQIKKLDEIFSS